MNPATKNIKTIDAYIKVFPREAQVVLKKLREVIKKSAPKAEEVISYQMPAFKMYENLVYFGAFKDHISFFPTASGVRVFQKELAGYATSKGTVQFPFDGPVPYGLVARIVKYRVKEVLLKYKAKDLATRCSRGHIFQKTKATPTCPTCWPGRYKKKAVKQK
jgi:uncharacterized protein YdhG (YjbR/CyaY superfamily)